MSAKDLNKLFNSIFKSDYEIQLSNTSLQSPGKDFRPNTVCVEDAFFGDSGKGSVTTKFNHILNKNKKLLSIRFNGGANAGHETLMNGKLIVTHQVPTGIIHEGATVLMTRGMVIHPQDLLSELEEIKSLFGGDLPGKLIIDERTTLTLDTHRALEGALNSITTGGRGSTGRGIAAGYASHYERIPVTLKDLLSSDWEDKLRAHYQLYSALISGFPDGLNLSDMQVVTHAQNKRTVGSVDTFIQRLQGTRSALRIYSSSDVYHILETAWNDPTVPITFEGAQGPGLDPFHGVYPDVTASRPMSRNINDATYNIIDPVDIFYRVAVLKTTYMSSVGTRSLPTIKNEKTEQWIQEAFDEKGRSTGRIRDIYPISIPIGTYLRKAAGYRFAVATHLDASKEDTNIEIITHYTDKKTGVEKPYLPFQDYLDTLEAHAFTFNGWDADEVKKATTFNQLPINARRFLGFLSQSIAPINMVTYGPDLKEFIKWNI
jgi:adenylosuccinate synthase